MDANLDFALGETADMIRETTQRFAADKIAPLAAKIDAEDWFPKELWPQMGELGLHGITVEEEYGGLGLGYLEHVIACEEVSRASASVGLSYGAHSNLCINQLRRWASPEQKAKYLPKLISGEHVGSLAMSEAGAGSDVVGMKLRAIIQDRSVAASFGINAKRVYALTFAYGAGLAGLAGALVSPLKSVSPDMGTGYVVDAFMVVVLGGVQSLAGTVASAFILGELSGGIAFLQNDTVAKAIVLLAIVVLIRFRPEGLFTARVRA